jgi:hypothetical protein
MGTLQYPPANGNDNNLCRTEQAMSQYGILEPYQHNVSWIDFCIMSSNTTNKVINQSEIGNLTNDKEMVPFWFDRLKCHLEIFDQGEVPHIYVAGKICMLFYGARIESSDKHCFSCRWIWNNQMHYMG